MSTAAAEVLEAALDYAGRGWKVVALYGVADSGACTCAEGLKCPQKSRGKHPCVGLDWKSKATTNEDTITAWLDQWPRANIGLVLGPESGIIDVEFDNERGRATAQRLFGEGCFTPTYKSGRSVHRLFKWQNDFPRVQKIDDWQGIEIRLGGDNKSTQSVAPPSTHWSGVQYEWLPGLAPWDVDVQEVSGELLEMLLLHDDGSPEAAKRIVDSIEGKSGSGKPKEYWDELLSGVAEGKRNEAITSLSGKLLRSLSNIDDDAAVHATLAAVLCLNQTNKPPLEEKEVRTTFGSILKREKQRRASEEAAPNFRKPPEQLVAADRAVGVDGWRMEVVDSDPTVFRLYADVWAGRSATSYVTLTKEQLTSTAKIKQEVAAQVRYPLPANFKKIWEGTSKDPGLFERLMFSAEVVEAPLEEKRGLVVAEWVYAKLSRAKDAETADPRGRPTRMPDGSVVFAFANIWQDMSMSADRVTRPELSKVLQQIGVRRKVLSINGSHTTQKEATAESLEKLRELIGHGAVA